MDTVRIFARTDFRPTSPVANPTSLSDRRRFEVSAQASSDKSDFARGRSNLAAKPSWVRSLGAGFVGQVRLRAKWRQNAGAGGIVVSRGLVLEGYAPS